MSASLEFGSADHPPFRLCELFFETRDFGLRHAKQAAELDRADLILFDRFAQRLVGDVEFLGGGGHGNPAPSRRLLIFTTLDSLDSLTGTSRRWSGGTFRKLRLFPDNAAFKDAFKRILRFLTEFS